MMYHKRLRLALLTVLPLCAGCPSLGEATLPAAPIDAEAVAPLWSTVLDRYKALTLSHVEPPVQQAWLLDAELLEKVLEAALNRQE